MTTISAGVVACSVCPSGVKLTTVECIYPWVIHPELLTHRVFARSSSSMRAIPTERLIADVEADPYVPVSFGRNQKGMQAGPELDELEREEAAGCWYHALHDAVGHARELARIGLHKQHASRLLLPFAHIRTVITSTRWQNFYDLRISDQAQPEMQTLAIAIRDAVERADPTPLDFGEWHAPYAPPDLPPASRVKVSAARCARVSYRTRDGRTPTLAEDYDLHDRLLAEKHYSPFEHQAQADGLLNQAYGVDLQGNLCSGWRQHRKLIEAGGSVRC